MHVGKWGFTLSNQVEWYIFSLPGVIYKKIFFVIISLAKPNFDSCIGPIHESLKILDPTIQTSP